MRLFLCVWLMLLISACGTGQFGSSYQSYMDPRLNPDLIALGVEQEPNILRSNDINADVQRYREHNYVVIGESAFNGLVESEGNAIRKAKDVGATHVLISSEYTDTQSYIDYDYQDYYRTTYVKRVITNSDGDRVVVRDAVTVRDTVTVPYMRTYDNYNQWAIFMVKSNNALRLGLVMRDLGLTERSDLGRNTGAYIDVVLTNSPGFLADIVPGDVLVAVNDVKVTDSRHAQVMIGNLEKTGETITLGLLKNGKQVNIVFEKKADETTS
jgi:hypothetical protein